MERQCEISRKRQVQKGTVPERRRWALRPDAPAPAQRPGLFLADGGAPSVRASDAEAAGDRDRRGERRGRREQEVEGSRQERQAGVGGEERGEEDRRRAVRCQQSGCST